MSNNLKKKAYYINLNNRVDRHYKMQSDWRGLVSLNRINGIKLDQEKYGAKGCFRSHVSAFKEVCKSNELSIIMEDDIVPTSSFVEKLNNCILELPNDWQMLMLGFNVSEFTSFSKVTDNISKANSHVVAGHCYIISPKFYKEFEAELNNIDNGENFDVLLINLQKKYNIYMCVPTLCYQYESFSDNSNAVVGNTQSTKKYFSE